MGVKEIFYRNYAVFCAAYAIFWMLNSNAYLKCAEMATLCSWTKLTMFYHRQRWKIREQPYHFRTATKNMGALEARLIKYFCHEHAIIIEKRCTSVSMRCRLFDRFVRFGTSAPAVLLVVKFSCFVMDSQSFAFTHRTWYMKQKCDFKSKFYRTSLQTSKCIFVNVQTKY